MKKRCIGKTTTGEQCRRKVAHGEYCHAHKPGEKWTPKEMDENGCMTQAAFARLLGVTDGAIRDYRQRGIVTMNGDGLIEVARALKSLECLGDSSRANSTRKVYRASGTGADTTLEQIEADGAGDLDALKLQKLRAQIAGLVHKARLHELRADELEGLLVSREMVDRESFAIGRLIRDQMLSIPDRMAAELSGMTDRAKIHEKLTIEITRVCTEAADRLEAMEFEPSA